ncbi:hypothetical protein OUY22_31480 [Nonomuraea sp. MCN248]|uniref:Uncharacterized protein n=1 Tax=Nonomuraea corallina TaxID=2989783 RepID=A0ABT4SLG2_9ACTN|nr:hypothetical protein [Nonomuraea corallina]MDA0637954.1 hypothetical protein [Nonomuraea corallina]
MSEPVLVRVCGTYCHPEADAAAYGSLRRLARRDDDEMTRFRTELRRALRTGDVPPGLFRAVRYPDGSAESFLRRLWEDLYPGEPV